MNETLAIVEKVDDEMKITRTATLDDLKENHPKCSECSHRKGVHGEIGREVVFCRVWNKTVDMTGYCSNFTR